MRIERPNVERDRIDLITACDNPACTRERYNGYSQYGGFAPYWGFEPDGWLKVGFDVDACSWACLAAVAEARAKVSA